MFYSKIILLIKDNKNFTASYAKATSDIIASLATTAFDTISDFYTSQSDKIDAKNILFGYDSITSAITDFVEFTTSGTNTIVKVDRGGTGTTYGWQQVSQLPGVTGMTDEVSLNANKNLIFI